MPLKLTKTMIERYVKADGLRCPHCESNALEGVGKPQIDGPVVSQKVLCNACKREWTDIYKLVGVNE